MSVPFEFFDHDKFIGLGSCHMTLPYKHFYLPTKALSQHPTKPTFLIGLIVFIIIVFNDNYRYFIYFPYIHRNPLTQYINYRRNSFFKQLKRLYLCISYLVRNNN